MTNPLQNYFATLQNERQGDELVLVTDSARILPKSKSFTVSSASHNDVKGMLLRSNSDSIGLQRTKRAMPSLLSRASSTARNKMQQLQQDDFETPSSFQNSRWSLPSQKQELCRTGQTVIDTEIFNLKDDSHIDKTDSDEESITFPFTARLASSHEETANQKSHNGTLLSKMVSDSPSSIMSPSPRSIRCNLQHGAKSIPFEESTDNSNESQLVLPANHGVPKCAAFSDQWWEELDVVLHSRTVSSGLGDAI